MLKTIFFIMTLITISYSNQFLTKDDESIFLSTKITVDLNEELIKYKNMENEGIRKRKLGNFMLGVLCPGSIIGGSTIIVLGGSLLIVPGLFIGAGGGSYFLIKGIVTRAKGKRESNKGKFEQDRIINLMK
jgi:hypothetical protein